MAGTDQLSSDTPVQTEIMMLRNPTVLKNSVAWSDATVRELIALLLCARLPLLLASKKAHAVM